MTNKSCLPIFFFLFFVIRLVDLFLFKSFCFGHVNCTFLRYTEDKISLQFAWSWSTWPNSRFIFLILRIEMKLLNQMSVCVVVMELWLAALTLVPCFYLFYFYFFLLSNIRAVILSWSFIHDVAVQPTFLFTCLRCHVWSTASSIWAEFNWIFVGTSSFNLHLSKQTIWRDHSDITGLKSLRLFPTNVSLVIYPNGSTSVSSDSGSHGYAEACLCCDERVQFTLGID